MYVLMNVPKGDAIGHISFQFTSHLRLFCTRFIVFNWTYPLCNWTVSLTKCAESRDSIVLCFNMFIMGSNRL